MGQRNFFPKKLFLLFIRYLQGQFFLINITSSAIAIDIVLRFYGLGSDKFTYNVPYNVIITYANSRAFPLNDCLVNKVYRIVNEQINSK